MYKVSFFTPKSRASPVEEFLDACEESLRTKILRQLKYAEEFGLTQSVPSLKKLTRTPLWELRILGKDNIRILCTALPEKQIKILHIFKKKSQKIPQKEIRIAINRYKEILDK